MPFPTIRLTLAWPFADKPQPLVELEQRPMRKEGDAIRDAGRFHPLHVRFQRRSSQMSSLVLG